MSSTFGQLIPLFLTFGQLMNSELLTFTPLLEKNQSLNSSIGQLMLSKSDNLWL